MKKTFKSTISFILAIVLVLSFVACNKVDATGLWENATYLNDTEFGNGNKTITVEVKVEDQSVVFTIHTDKDTVGAALIEHDLIAGDEGAYGLYIKVVNGITADYDIDQSYWAFYEGENYANQGIYDTNVTDGGVYKLVYTIG